MRTGELRVDLAGRQIIGEVLRVIRADLQLRLIPNLTDSDAQRSAQMMDTLLSYLSAWHLEIADRLESFETAYGECGQSGGPARLVSEFPIGGERLGEMAEALQSRVETEGLADQGRTVAMLGTVASTL